MNMEQVTTAMQPLSVEQLRALHSNLSRDRIKQRQRMSYLEAWDVKASLIRVFGFGGFSAECIESRIEREEQIPQSDNPNKMNWSVSYKATVRLTIPQLGAVYTESAIGNNKQPDWAEAADTALKSAESDALKRAAIFLGTQFGLSLYNDGSTMDVVTTVLAPGQSGIISDINAARVDSPEKQNAIARLQARMKVDQTEVPAVVVEPTVTELPAPATIPVATITGPGPAVAKALENAERTAKELDQAERDTRGNPSTKKRQTKPTVTANKAAVARQALANAERFTGTTPVGGAGDPYLANYGPGSPEFVMDDEIQAREDAGL